MSEQPDKSSETQNGPKKILFLITAGVLTAIGAVGALLPVLPTTPFLLLASFFLARSSPRLNKILLQSKFLGPILRDWQEQNGIRSHVRWQAIVTVVVVLTLTIIFVSPSPIISGCIAGLGAIGIMVILRLPGVDAN